LPVIMNIPLALDTEQLLSRQGIGSPEKVKPSVVQRSQEMLDTVYRERLLSPAIAYEIYPVKIIKKSVIILEKGTELNSRLLSNLLSRAKALGIAIYTIGKGLEDRVATYFRQGEAMKALLLDGIGNAFLDSLSQEVCQIMGREASSRGYRASSPVNPGTPGWSLAEQRNLFHLVSAAEAGISLTARSMMIPQKTLSAVFGIGTDVPQWSPVEACQRCNIKDSCAYRLRT
jgi:cobalamin-dependent methionine synthase I